MNENFRFGCDFCNFGYPNFDVFGFQNSQSGIVSFRFAVRPFGCQQHVITLFEIVRRDHRKISDSVGSVSVHAYHRPLCAFRFVVSCRQLQPVFRFHADPFEGLFFQLFHRLRQFLGVCGTVGAKYAVQRMFLRRFCLGSRERIPERNVTQQEHQSDDKSARYQQTTYRRPDDSGHIPVNFQQHFVSSKRRFRSPLGSFILYHKILISKQFEALFAFRSLSERVF